MAGGVLTTIDKCSKGCGNQLLRTTLLVQRACLTFLKQFFKKKKKNLLKTEHKISEGYAEKLSIRPYYSIICTQELSKKCSSI